MIFAECRLEEMPKPDKKRVSNAGSDGRESRGEPRNFGEMFADLMSLKY